ncbi:MAG: NAD(P)H-dependent glycerol-3-phosphate dehydrogenase [Oscillospiraceae bacterium]
MAKVMVLGAGSFGIALALLGDELNDVTLWTHSNDLFDKLIKDRENKKLLKGIKIPNTINITTDISLAKDMDIIIVAVPSFAVEETVLKIKNFIMKKTVIVSVAKGIEKNTLQCFSTVIENILPANKIVALSGPSHAEEVAKKMLAVLVCASKNEEASIFIQKQLSTKYMRIYVNNDILGVELGGALKNIIALTAGVLDGLSLGDNAKAALVTRGLKEITRLGVKMGGKPETFSGLSGMGDLIVTCISEYSRNRKAGILIGQGLSANDAIKQVGTVEGYYATLSAKKLCQKHNIEMPITDGMYKVLFEGNSAKGILSELMSRPQKSEREFLLD